MLVDDGRHVFPDRPLLQPRLKRCAVKHYPAIVYSDTRNRGSVNERPEGALAVVAEECHDFSRRPEPTAE
jgi:hypothetical protein